MRKQIIATQFIFFIIINLFIIENVISQQVKNSVQQKDAVKYMQYTTIDVLVILYTNTPGAKISDEEISGIKSGLKLAREFYWRNSGCKLNLNLSYLEISESKPKSFFPYDGLLWPNLVEQDFKNHGVEENQYGIIVLIYGPPLGGGNYGGMTILDKSGYSFFRYPFRTSVLYPGEDTSIEYKCTWLFTHELQHSVDLVCYEKSGYPSMWHGDQPLDYAIQAGEQFSYQAEIFRNFKDYLKINRPWGDIFQTVDMDEDNFPDNEPKVPMDEYRFGSDSTKIDTDSDELPDLKEYMAGIYRSSNPNKTDTDNDGLIDGKDPYPLNKTNPEIPALTPDLNADLSSWYLLTNTVNFSSSDFIGNNPISAKIYMCWDENFLYFASETDAPAELHLDLDLNNDGWWNGKDNYRFVVDPFSDRFTEIRAMDTTERARKLRLKLGRGFCEMWDDEPKYISQFGRLIDEFSVTLRTSSTEAEFVIKMAIPKNKLVGFNLTPNSEIGVRIYYYQISDPKTAHWATVFEQYSFFDVILK